MRVLFSTQAGSGHWRPLLPLARAAQAAGHAVAFASTPVACTALRELGFPSFPVGIDEWLPHLRSAFPHAHDPTAPVETIWVEVFVKTRAKRALPDLLSAWRGASSGSWMVAADVAWPAYFGRRHLGSIRSTGFSVGVAGAALGPLPFGLAYDLLGGYDPAIAALWALPIAATAAVLLAKPPALERPTVATAERRG